MTTIDQKIVEFLNIPLSSLEKVEQKTLTEMRNAVIEDDMFALHHLGYKVNADRAYFTAPPGTGKVREFISIVNEMEPCILFIEELEKEIKKQQS